MSAPESPVPPSRLKRWAPTLVGLAFAGVGLAATGVALSQVEISIRPPEAPTGEPDPVDLLRDDVATASLPAGQALANAPLEADGGFVVPAVLSES